MFTRETLRNFGKSLENGEQRAFLTAVDGMKEETRGELAVVLNETIEGAGFGHLIAKLNASWRRFVPVDSSIKLNVLRSEQNLP